MWKASAVQCEPENLGGTYCKVFQLCLRIYEIKRCGESGRNDKEGGNLGKVHRGHDIVLSSSSSSQLLNIPLAVCGSVKFKIPTGPMLDFKHLEDGLISSGGKTGEEADSQMSTNALTHSHFGRHPLLANVKCGKNIYVF